MNLHYETVSPLLKETLQKLVNSPIFKDFTLIGGTCLSLQLGHRRSIDIDLFTDIDYGTMNTKEMKEFIQRSFPYSENTDSLDTSALGYTLYMGDSPIDKIKVDFFYTEKFIFPIQEIDHIRIADIREIAAMKLSAITEEEPRQKDFWDIHELIPPAYHGEHLSVSLCIMQFLDFSLAQKSAKRFFSSICKNTVGLRLHKDNKLLAKRVYEPFIFLPYYLKIQCL